MNNHYRTLKTLGKLSHILACALMIASLLVNAIPPETVHAGAGSIWTTLITCSVPDVPQNANQYAVGQTVHIRGSNFDPVTTVYWQIFKPGNNSDILIDSGEGVTDINGYFCVTAHTILPGEDGVYKYEVTVGNSKKSDNYSVVGIIAAPALSIDKNASPSTYTATGQSITYTYLVINTGNVELTNISVVDDKVSVTCPTTTLAAGASMTCNASYTITQADLDAGSVTNVAHAAGDYAGTPVTSNQDTVTITAIPKAQLTITKSATPGTYDAVNQTISYSYVVTNTGNVTLTGITVTDDKASVSCPASTLAPTGSMTCTATYSISQADLDLGFVTNIATADSDQTGQVQDSKTVNANTVALLSINKSVSSETYASVGDVITYSYEITNNGNVTLTNIVVTDDRLGSICTVASLAPQASTTCTASHTITLANLNAGSITNVGTADSDQTGEVTDTETVTAVQDKNISLDKRAAPANYDAVGDVISYEYVVTNTGNITLTNITVVDDKASVSCPGDTLLPGESMTCTASHTITQADLNNGSVTNVATVTSDQTQAVQDIESVTAVQLPKVTMEKSADPASYAAVGDIISYEYLVHNTGNITLTGVYVLDDKAIVTCPSDTLAPLSSMTCTAEYSIMQADLDEGFVINTAQVFSGETDPYTDTAIVNAQIEAVLTITKAASPSSYQATGDIIDYTYVVTNDGNVTLSALAVFDDKTSVTCPEDTLLPGESMTCTAQYSVTDADMAAWSVTNVAYAEGVIGRTDGEGQEPGETVRSNEATAQVPRFIPPALSSFCSADPLNYDGWRVVNHNLYPVSFEYIIADSNIAGVGEVPANGVAEIYTPHGAGNGQLRLYSAGVLLDTARAAMNCAVNETLPPEVPVAPTPFVVIPPTGPVLIPVTGAANPLHIPAQRLLFSLSIGFAGVGFLLQGFSRRRKEI